jgi:putative membrane protein
MSNAGLSAQDHTRISEAIRAAEAGTSGEIYVVVAHSADDFHFVPVLWAAIAALILPWPLHLLTTLSSTAILLAQAIFFAVTASALSHPSIRYALVPRGIAAESTRKHAHALFFAHGVHLTQARTGVLIYVALLQRQVEIVADAGIHGKVAQSAWDELAGAVTDAAREGRLADGIVDAVRRAGVLLAAHFPPKPDDVNELSDRVVEI